MPRATILQRRFLKFAYRAAALACLFPVCLLGGQEPAASEPHLLHTVTLTEMFTFLFLMLGPIKILGPFVQLTRNDDDAFSKRLAIRAFLFSCAALVFAAFVGERSMRKYHVSVPVLAIAAGIILFLVALQTVMHQFDSSAPTHREYEPSMRLAVGRRSICSFSSLVNDRGRGHGISVYDPLDDDVVAYRDIRKRTTDTFYDDRAARCVD